MRISPPGQARVARHPKLRESPTRLVRDLRLPVSSTPSPDDRVRAPAASDTRILGDKTLRRPEVLCRAMCGRRAARRIRPKIDDRCVCYLRAARVAGSPRRLAPTAQDPGGR